VTKGKRKSKKELNSLRKFLHEFKVFAIKGNMVDMAVGLIVGGAFTALLNSIIGNLATPLIGILIGVDFQNWEIILPRLYGDAPPNILAIGLFLNSLISFVIIALMVFLFVKALNNFRKKHEETNVQPKDPSKEELLLTEIRDILKESRSKK